MTKEEPANELQDTELECFRRRVMSLGMGVEDPKSAGANFGNSQTDQFSESFVSGETELQRMSLSTLFKL